jgi:hypothetical protein
MLIPTFQQRLTAHPETIIMSEQVVASPDAILAVDSATESGALSDVHIAPTFASHDAPVLSSDFSPLSMQDITQQLQAVGEVASDQASHVTIGAEQPTKHDLDNTMINLVDGDSQQPSIGAAPDAPRDTANHTPDNTMINLVDGDSQQPSIGAAPVAPGNNVDVQSSHVAMNSDQPDGQVVVLEPTAAENLVMDGGGNPVKSKWRTPLMSVDMMTSFPQLDGVPRIPERTPTKLLNRGKQAPQPLDSLPVAITAMLGRGIVDAPIPSDLQWAMPAPAPAKSPSTPTSPPGLNKRQPYTSIRLGPRKEGQFSPPSASQVAAEGFASTTAFINNSPSGAGSMPSDTSLSFKLAFPIGTLPPVGGSSLSSPGKPADIPFRRTTESGHPRSSYQDSLGSSNDVAQAIIMKTSSSGTGESSRTAPVQAATPHLLREVPTQSAQPEVPTRKSVVLRSHSPLKRSASMEAAVFEEPALRAAEAEEEILLETHDGCLYKFSAQHLPEPLSSVFVLDKDTLLAKVSSPKSCGWVHVQDGDQLIGIHGIAATVLAFDDVLLRMTAAACPQAMIFWRPSLAAIDEIWDSRAHLIDPTFAACTISATRNEAFRSLSLANNTSQAMSLPQDRIAHAMSAYLETVQQITRVAPTASTTADTKTEVQVAATTSTPADTKIEVQVAPTASTPADTKTEVQVVATASTPADTKTEVQVVATASTPADTKTEVQVVATASTPADTKTEVQVASTASTPVDTKTEVQVVATASTPADTKTEVQVASTASTPVDTKTEVQVVATASTPADTKTEVQVVATASTPADTKTEVQVAPTASTPVDTKTEVQVASTASTPVDTKTEVQVAATASTPVDTKTEVQVAATASTPADTKTEVQVAPTASTPVDTKTEVQVAPTASTPVDTKTEVQVVATASTPADTKTEVQVAPTASTPVDTKTEVQVASTASTPVDTKTEVQVAATASTPVDTKAEVQAADALPAPKAVLFGSSNPLPSASTEMQTTALAPSLQSPGSPIDAHAEAEAEVLARQATLREVIAYINQDLQQSAINGFHQMHAIREASAVHHRELSAQMESVKSKLLGAAAELQREADNCGDVHKKRQFLDDVAALREQLSAALQTCRQQQRMASENTWKEEERLQADLAARRNHLQLQLQQAANELAALETSKGITAQDVSVYGGASKATASTDVPNEIHAELIRLKIEMGAEVATLKAELKRQQQASEHASLVSQHRATVALHSAQLDTQRSHASLLTAAQSTEQALQNVVDSDRVALLTELDAIRAQLLAQAEAAKSQEEKLLQRSMVEQLALQRSLDDTKTHLQSIIDAKVGEMKAFADAFSLAQSPREPVSPPPVAVTPTLEHASQDALRALKDQITSDIGTLRDAMIVQQQEAAQKAAVIAQQADISVKSAQDSANAELQRILHETVAREQQIMQSGATEKAVLLEELEHLKEQMRAHQLISEAAQVDIERRAQGDLSTLREEALRSRLELQQQLNARSEELKQLQHAYDAKLLEAQANLRQLQQANSERFAETGAYATDVARQEAAAAAASVQHRLQQDISDLTAKLTLTARQAEEQATEISQRSAVSVEKLVALVAEDKANMQRKLSALQESIEHAAEKEKAQLQQQIEDVKRQAIDQQSQVMEQQQRILKLAEMERTAIEEQSAAVRQKLDAAIQAKEQELIATRASYQAGINARDSLIARLQSLVETQTQLVDSESRTRQSAEARADHLRSERSILEDKHKQLIEQLEEVS